MWIVKSNALSRDLPPDQKETKMTSVHGVKHLAHFETLAWTNVRCIVSFSDRGPNFYLFIHFGNTYIAFEANEILLNAVIAGNG